MLRGLLSHGTNHSSSLKHKSLSDDEDDDSDDYDGINWTGYKNNNNNHHHQFNCDTESDANSSMMVRHHQEKPSCNTKTRYTGGHCSESAQPDSLDSFISETSQSSNQQRKKNINDITQCELSPTLTSCTTLSSSESTDESEYSSNKHLNVDTHHQESCTEKLNVHVDLEEDDIYDSLHQPVSYLKQSIPDLEDILNSLRNQSNKKSNKTTRSIAKNKSSLSLKNNNEEDFDDDNDDDDSSSNASSYNSGFSSSSEESISESAQNAAYNKNQELEKNSNPIFNNRSSSTVEKTSSIRTGDFDLINNFDNCSYLSRSSISINSTDSSIPDTTQIAAFYKDQERLSKSNPIVRNEHVSPTIPGSSDSFNKIIPNTSQISAYCNVKTQSSLKRSSINLSPTSTTDVAVLDAEAIIANASPISSNGSQSQQEEKKHLSVSNHRRRDGSNVRLNDKKNNKAKSSLVGTRTEASTTIGEDDVGSPYRRNRLLLRNRNTSLSNTTTAATATGKSSLGKNWARKKRIDQSSNSTYTEKNCSSNAGSKSSIEPTNSSKEYSSPSLEQELVEMAAPAIAASIGARSTDVQSSVKYSIVSDERIINPLAQELAELTTSPMKLIKPTNASNRTRNIPNVLKTAPKRAASSSSNRRTLVVERFDCDTGEIISSENVEISAAKKPNASKSIKRNTTPSLIPQVEIKMKDQNYDPLAIPINNGVSVNVDTEKSSSDSSPRNGEKSSGNSSDKVLVRNDIANATNVIENMVLLFAKSDVEGIRRLLGESLESSVSSLSTSSTFSADDVDFNQCYRDGEYDDISDNKCGSDKQEAKHLRTVSKLLQEKRNGYKGRSSQLSNTNNYTMPLSTRGIVTHYSISILLIEPIHKVFEIVMVDVTRSTTLKEAIHHACMAAADPTLAGQTYISLCNDVKILSNLSSPISKLIQPPIPITINSSSPISIIDIDDEKQKRDTDHMMRKEMERQLLVAVPNKSSFKECYMIRKILWKNPKLQLWWSSYHLKHYNTETVLPWSNIPIST